MSLTNGSGFGSGRPKNIWILRIRIRNNAAVLRINPDEPFISGTVPGDRSGPQKLFLVVRNYLSHLVGWINVHCRGQSACRHCFAPIGRVFVGIMLMEVSLFF
jgi:hypothetical protein